MNRGVLISIMLKILFPSHYRTQFMSEPSIVGVVFEVSSSSIGVHKRLMLIRPAGPALRRNYASRIRYESCMGILISPHASSRASIKTHSPYIDFRYVLSACLLRSFATKLRCEMRAHRTRVKVRFPKTSVASCWRNFKVLRLSKMFSVMEVGLRNILFDGLLCFLGSEVVWLYTIRN